jgi:SAM-dependent methyltransferase
VPLLLRLLSPSSVVDVGCGTGTWLGEFRRQGVSEIRGLDGDWVDRSDLRIPEEHFQLADLTQPPRLERTFDLVVSLEVAEHLPPEAADDFVALLAGLGPAIAFSAAIPGQGGTGHVNEQWPAYWSRRFAEHGFLAVDAIRPEIWMDEQVAWWFRQNLVLYVGEDRLGDYPSLPSTTTGELLPLVHPELFEDRVRALAAPPPSTPAKPTAPPAPPPALQRLRSRVQLRTRLRALRARLRRPRRRRIFALLPVRDEMRFLPDLFANLEGQVDGVIALDDGSTDGSGEFLAKQPLVVELLTVAPGEQEELEENKNQRALLEAAWRHEADWLLAIDADERLERDWRRRAEAEIDRAEAEGHPALWMPFRELWGSRDQVRVDGVWGEKRKASLFKADPDARFQHRRLHSIWAPWPPPNGEYPTADLRLYHLRMISESDRRARMERYKRLDPEREWQEIGYDYLLDEEGIELEPVEPGRDFVP